MRKPHILEASKKTEKIERMIFFDSESKVTLDITDDEIERKENHETVRKPHDLYLICATFHRERTDRKNPTIRRGEYHTLNSPDPARAFWSDVDRFAANGKKILLFAHNAKYDVQATSFNENLVALGYTCSSFCDENPFIVEYEKHAPDCLCKPCIELKELPEDTKTRDKIKRILILSSTNYYQQSLASLGKIFKLPKLDFDHTQEIDPQDPAFMEKALIYCRRDVEILIAAMLTFISFIQRENLGNFCVTVAGQSFTAFRRRFLTERIHIHSDQRALDVERRAYAGGRNECFNIGAIPHIMYCVDINSMYPTVMRSELYPTKLITFWEKCTLRQLREQLRNGRLVCADCVVNTDKPIFHKKKGKLIFPIGTFETSLSTPEIKVALERGMLVSVKNVAIYEGGSIFKAFVDYFYGKRLEAKKLFDNVHDHLYKIFLNALYGKFGQKNIQWVRVDDADPSISEAETIWDADTHRLRTRKTFGGGVFEKVEDPDDLEAFNSFPAIASHVTSYARMLLWEYIEIADIENVAYCDTDSLFVNDWGYQLLWLNDMVDSKRLGALKLEKYNSDLKIYGCKDYFFDGKQKTKGISSKAVSLPDSKEGKKRFAVTQWGGFTDRLKDGGFKHYSNRVMIKTLARNYDKGTILMSGAVLPFVEKHII